MDKGLLKGLNLDLSYKVPDITDIGRQLDIQMEDINDHISEMNEKKARYDQEVLETLKKIESNTVGLNEVVPLLSESLEKQDEILDYLKEALSISASKSMEEAESKWRTLMKKATELTKDVETIKKLTGFATTVLSLFSKMNGGP